MGCTEYGVLHLFMFGASPPRSFMNDIYRCGLNLFNWLRWWNIWWMDPSYTEYKSSIRFGYTEYNSKDFSHILESTTVPLTRLKTPRGWHARLHYGVQVFECQYTYGAGVQSSRLQCPIWFPHFVLGSAHSKISLFSHFILLSTLSLKLDVSYSLFQVTWSTVNNFRHLLWNPRV